MAKLFKIIEIDNEGDTIVVTLEGGYEIKINTDDFNSFLKTNDRLEYINDNVQNGEHIQFSGTLSLDEYWDAEMKYIEPDVYDFLILKMNSKQGATGVLQSFYQKLLSVA